jgi:hypothetical protein
MGFVNKITGIFNKQQWNWNTPGTTPSTSLTRRAFHVETKNEQFKKDRQQPTLSDISTSAFVSNELLAGNQSMIRGTNIKTKRTATKIPVVQKKYRDLAFSEANMVMYLNTLDYDLLNPDSDSIGDILDQTNITDSDLESAYSEMVDNYNKKDFDPEDQTLVDGNGNEITHTIQTILETKSSPVMPTLSEFKERYRLSNRKATYRSVLQRKGYA